MKKMSVQTKKRLFVVVILIVVWFANISLATMADLLTLSWYVYLLWKREEQSASD